MKHCKNLFDKINSLIGTVAAITSLIIAVIALNSVTKVEGFKDLLQKTSTNNLELNKMIKVLKKQDSLQQIELNELGKQTKTLSDIQKSNSNQLDLQNKEERSMLIGDYLVLSSLYWKLHKLKSIPDNKVFFDESYKGQTIQYLQDLKSVINEGINTKLLKMYDKIYSQWWFFYRQIDFTINSLNDTISLDPVSKYYNIPIKIERQLNSKIINKKESDLYHLKGFAEYLKTFWIKGASPMIEIKEMNYYYLRYQNLSNFGRTIRE